MGKGKKYVEHCLWEYKANAGMLEQLRREAEGLRSVRGHSYEAHVESNGHTDPVADVVNKVMAIERKIRRTEDMVMPVQRLEADILAGCYREGCLRDIFRMRYMER